MQQTYKYQPEQFAGMLSIADDLSAFYTLHEKYRKTKSRLDWHSLQNHWENLLYFSIKHREIEGYLSPPMASDIRVYCEELLYD